MSRRTIVVAAVVVLLGGAGFLLVRDHDRRVATNATGAADHAALYQCSMHSQIVSDHPGTCPICQMRLERVDEVAPAPPPPASAAAGQGGAPLFYRHPMRPDVTSAVPAKDEMGMDYIAVYEDDAGRGTASTVPGHAPFTLSAERQQLIGVTRARVESRELTREIRVPGRVAYDPVLYETIAEYREALRSKREIEASPWLEAHEGADALVRSATLKLRQQGLSEEQIRGLARERAAPTNLLLPGATMWVYAQVYEHDLGLVAPGQAVTITAPTARGKVYTARVAALDPRLDAKTQSARVRIEVPTPERELRPETFVHVTIAVPLGTVLAVPESAVVDTGERQIAFVVRDRGRFEPRALTLGREAEGYYEVLSGLTAGEEVVTAANFLIDSESRFRAALAAFGKAPATGHVH